MSFTEAANNGNITTTDPTIIVGPSPLGGDLEKYIIRRITVHNNDTSEAAFYLTYWSTNPTRILFRVVLQPNETWVFKGQFVVDYANNGMLVLILDANGDIDYTIQYAVKI